MIFLYNRRVEMKSKDTRNNDENWAIVDTMNWLIGYSSGKPRCYIRYMEAKTNPIHALSKYDILSDPNTCKPIYNSEI